MSKQVMFLEKFAEELNEKSSEAASLNTKLEEMRAMCATQKVIQNFDSCLWLAFFR